MPFPSLSVLSPFRAFVMNIPSPSKNNSQNETPRTGNLSVSRA